MRYPDGGGLTAAERARRERVSPGYSRLALADAQQRYDDAIGDFPV